MKAELDYKFIRKTVEVYRSKTTPAYSYLNGMCRGWWGACRQGKRCSATFTAAAAAPYAEQMTNGLIIEVMLTYADVTSL
jgi:hypothetical protein